MRIGLDGRYVQDHFPGIGRYTFNLIRGLASVAGDTTVVVVHNPRLTNSRYDMAALHLLPHVEMIECNVGAFSLAEQVDLPRLARRLGLDVWHAPYYICPYVLPCPLVVTIHDAIGSRYPQYLPSAAARLSYESAMRLAMRVARSIIAVSQASRDDLVHFFGANPSTVAVVAEAASDEYRPQPAAAIAGLRQRLGLPSSYVLYVGMNKPHKNLVMLIEAWARLTPSLPQPSPHLIIAGRQDVRYPQAAQAAATAGAAGTVRFLGDVAEADLPSLYSGAQAFVFPSLYEGFGLPPLEAMACGVPVICSTTPALREVVGDAALTVDAANTVAWVETIGRVLADQNLQQDLRRRGTEQARRFSWQRTAADTLRVYRAVLSQT